MPGKIALPRGPIDAWGWRWRITGTCSCDPGYATVVLRVNGVEIEVPREGERFSVVVPLQEGTNHVVASCRHHDGMACKPAQATLKQRLSPRPTATVRLDLGPDGIMLDGLSSAPREATAAPVVKYRWRPRPGNPERLSLRCLTSEPSGACATVAPPRREGEYYVSLTVTDAHGQSDTATACFVVDGENVRLPNIDTEHPAWVEQAVVYGVVPHNFGADGLRSVVARLDDLRDLGIDAIWLAPCTDTKGKGHGYGVSDYFAIRRDYGTKRDFRKLVKEAHARGIRVLMDFVPNHSSAHHPYMEHVAKHGRSSPYYAFYEWHDDGEHFAHYFHWRHLPNLNYDNPEVRGWMTEAFSYWVREFDVDGFRVDAAWGVKLRRPDFWPEWRRELKRIKPDLLLLAEASARDPYYFTHGFDAAYDWTDDLGKWSMEHVFEDQDQIVSRLHAALTNEGRGFHEDALIFRFLDNNDTGPRFITRHGPGMERVAAAMLLTLPGLPCIYTGQEVGAEFEPYKTLVPISWEDRDGLRRYYERLISLRRRFPSLHSRKWEVLPVESEHQVYGYLRGGAADDQPVLVVLNFSDAPTRAEVKLPERHAGWVRGRGLTDLISGRRVRVTGTGRERLWLDLPGHSAQLLVVEDDLLRY
jgi:glycosidase